MADDLDSVIRITSTTRRTTTYADGGSTGPITYRAGVTPRNVIIQRTTKSVGPTGPGYGRASNQLAMTSSVYPTNYTQLSSTELNTVKSSSEKEKKDMQGLNERFASYIEKVRFLEAQNKRLSEEVDKLKSRWGQETSNIKKMYQAELDEARRLLDEAEKEKARLEVKTASLEEVNEDLRQNLDEANRALEVCREQIDRQNKQLSDYEGEINMLRRRVEGLETDREKDKKQIGILTATLNSTRANLDHETLSHIDAENRRQTLEEELEFLKSIHEQELKELAALAYRDTTNENRDFWKNEMGNALREIQELYDEKLDLMRTEIESSYGSKLQEFRNGATRQNMETVHSKEETKRLRNQLTDQRDKIAELEAKVQMLQRELEQCRRQKDEMEREFEHENDELKREIARLRAEIESILQELQSILDTKLGLELEIAAYRRLLEGEETRTGFKDVVDSWLGGKKRDKTPDKEPSNGVQLVVAKGEISARTTFQKSAKGPTSIAECSADGKYIILENTGRKEETLDDWKVIRTVDGQETLNFVFPENSVLPAGEKITLWCYGSKPDTAPETDIETSIQHFGVGSNIVTKLFNPAEEDRATHIQKTVYS